MTLHCHLGGLIFGWSLYLGAYIRKFTICVDAVGSILFVYIQLYCKHLIDFFRSQPTIVLQKSCIIRECQLCLKQLFLVIDSNHPLTIYLIFFILHLFFSDIYMWRCGQGRMIKQGRWPHSHLDLIASASASQSMVISSICITIKGLYLRFF